MVTWKMFVDTWWSVSSPGDSVIFQFLLGLDSERGSHASPVQAPLSVVQSRCVVLRLQSCSLLWGPSREQKERKILCLEQGEPVRLKVIGHVRVALFPAAIWMKSSVLDEGFRCRSSLFIRSSPFAVIWPHMKLVWNKFPVSICFTTSDPLYPHLPFPFLLKHSLHLKVCAVYLLRLLLCFMSLSECKLQENEDLSFSVTMSLWSCSASVVGLH